MIGQFYKSVKFLVFFISPLLLKASVKNFSLYLFLCCQFTLISSKCCYFLPIPRYKILHLFQIFAPDSLTQPNTVRLKDFRKYYLQYLKIQVNMILKLMQKMCFDCNLVYGPRQANLVLIAYASSEGSGEPAHPPSLARTFAARSYKQ